MALLLVERSAMVHIAALRMDTVDLVQNTAKRIVDASPSVGVAEFKRCHPKFQRNARPKPIFALLWI